MEAALQGGLYIPSFWEEFRRTVREVGLALMGDMTNFEESAYLTHRFKGGAAMGQLTSSWVALFTVTPGETGGGTEVSGSAYARLEMEDSDWSAVTADEPSTIENSADKSYPAASGGNWGTVVAVGWMDDPTAGNMVFFKALGTSKAVNDGDIAKFLAGNLKLGVG